MASAALVLGSETPCAPIGLTTWAAWVDGLFGDCTELGSWPRGEEPFRAMVPMVIAAITTSTRTVAIARSRREGRCGRGRGRGPAGGRVSQPRGGRLDGS